MCTSSKMSLAGESGQKLVAYAVNKCIFLLENDKHEEVTRSFERKRKAEFWYHRPDPWEDDCETWFP